MRVWIVEYNNDERYSDSEHYIVHLFRTLIDARAWCESAKNDREFQNAYKDLNWYWENDIRYQSTHNGRETGSFNISEWDVK